MSSLYPVPSAELVALPYGAKAAVGVVVAGAAAEAKAVAGFLAVNKTAAPESPGVGILGLRDHDAWEDVSCRGRASRRAEPSQAKPTGAARVSVIEGCDEAWSIGIEDRDAGNSPRPNQKGNSQRAARHVEGVTHYVGLG